MTRTTSTVEPMLADSDWEGAPVTTSLWLAGPRPGLGSEILIDRTDPARTDYSCQHCQSGDCQHVKDVKQKLFIPLIPRE